MRQKYKGNIPVADDPYFTLNRFCGGASPPVLIVPPFAGRDGTVTQNLIDTCRLSGRAVYAYELKSATQETKDLSIAGLIDIVQTCCNLIQSETGSSAVDMVGCCQGGWLAAMFAALYPERVNKLALMAAPINMHTEQSNQVEDYCRALSLPLHKCLVAMNWGVQPGFAQWWAFAMLAPQQIFLGRYLDLIAHMVNGRDEEVKKWTVVNGWYDSPNDLAGVWFLDALEQHFCANRLYKGTWKVGARYVDLRNINCPVLVFAGALDDITSIPQAAGVLEKVRNGELIVFPAAGHTKTFTGKAELSIFFNKFFFHELDCVVCANEGRRYETKGYSKGTTGN